MPLPVLPSTPSGSASPSDLVRLFHRTELHWTRHLGEESTLEIGTAFTNAELPSVYNANRILDASVPEGSTAEQVMEEAAAHYRDRGTPLGQILLNPAVPDERTKPLADYLLAAG